jgi:hypothetical protein
VSVLFLLHLSMAQKLEILLREDWQASERQRLLHDFLQSAFNATSSQPGAVSGATSAAVARKCSELFTHPQVCCYLAALRKAAAMTARMSYHVPKAATLHQ